MIEKILTGVCAELNCWAGAVLKPNDQMTHMICLATYNLPDDWVKSPNVLDGNSMNSKAYLQKSVVIDNRQNFPKPHDAKTIHTVYAAAVVPIQKQNEIIGTLELLSDRKDVIFGNFEITRMKQSATQLAKLV